MAVFPLALNGMKLDAGPFDEQCSTIKGKRNRHDRQAGLYAASRERVAQVMPTVARALITSPCPYHSSQPTCPTTGHSRTASKRLSTAGSKVRTATAGGAQTQAAAIRAATALAKAGFVVAALPHTGENWRDQSRATDVVGRARQLSVLIDYMTQDWDGRAGIDAGRITAFGLSAGGFLAAAGGDPDLSRLAGHETLHREVMRFFQSHL